MFDVLADRATNAGRMVSREELIDEVWGTRLVTAAAVSSRIRSAQAATGDDGVVVGEPRLNLFEGDRCEHAVGLKDERLFDSDD